ncbi:MRG-domain-containing protein [Mycena rebaudengoi]|nr:MRG-domain-containing protein [Mycena rebaudengoi]
MSEPPPAYNSGENVLCYHGPLIYAAKILKIQTVDEKNTMTGKEGLHYFVHYKGWKTTWDEWVPSDRLLKDNEVNRVLQKSLQKNAPTAAAAARSNPKASTSGATKDSGSGISASANTRSGTRKEAGTRGTKRGRDDTEGYRRVDMKLNIPEQIKSKLIDDWETVTKDNRLVILPRVPSVQQLLKEFEAHLIETKPAHLKDPAVLAPTIIEGLLVYFDRSLANHLLYRFERPQHLAMREKYITGEHVVVGEEKPMSEIYGAEHLLRMLVTLPAMIAQSTLDPESTELVRDYANELLSWMLQENVRLFSGEYIDHGQGSAYLNIARS